MPLGLGISKRHRRSRAVGWSVGVDAATDKLRLDDLGGAMLPYPSTAAGRSTSRVFNPDGGPVVDGSARPAPHPVEQSLMTVKDLRMLGSTCFDVGALAAADLGLMASVTPAPARNRTLADAPGAWTGLAMRIFMGWPVLVP